MLLTARHLLLLLAAIGTAVGVVILLWRDAQVLAWVVIACGAVSIAVLTMFPAWGGGGPPVRRESEDITTLSDQRRRELVRGTSLYLRELQYRYSIRLIGADDTEHRAFTAEVNSIRLGFVPVVITDNTNDRQGHGYVAFVHDGRRWRGPGLPCPAGQVEAVRHAAKCVSPLSKDEETRF